MVKTEKIKEFAIAKDGYVFCIKENATAEEIAEKIQEVKDYNDNL